MEIKQSYSNIYGTIDEVIVVRVKMAKVSKDGKGIVNLY